MGKFHYNPATGEAGRCHAQPGSCPFLSDEEHYPTKALAQRAFEQSMEDALAPSVTREAAWVRHGNLDPDVFLSVLTPTNDVVTERFAPDLSEDLEPGDYAVSFRDGNIDRFGVVTVKQDGSFTFKPTKELKSVNSPSTEKTLKAITDLRLKFAELSETSAASNGEIDPVTTAEIQSEINRGLLKYDWNTAVGATLGRLHLEDVEWVIDHDLALARREGLTEEENSLSRSKKLVSDCLESLRKG